MNARITLTYLAAAALLSACEMDTFGGVYEGGAGDSPTSDDAPSDVTLESGNGGDGDVDATVGDVFVGDVFDGGTVKPYRRIFITSSTYAANFGGLAAADAICNTVATGALLGGTWAAWLSTQTTSAGSRLEHATVPYQLLDGTKIASDWAGLTSGSIAHVINLDEHKNVVPLSTNLPITGETWTGTMGDGTSAASTDECAGWTNTSSTASVMIGGVGWTNQEWTAGGETACDAINRAFFCIEQK